MPDDGPDPGLMRVNTELVRDQLVGALLAAAHERPADELPGELAKAIATRFDGEAETRMARLGYLGRLAETERFEAARAAIPWLAQALADRERDLETWTSAAVAVSVDLARAEPDGRPDPESRTASWRVPGPGGHVRHYVAAAAAGELGLPEGGAETAGANRASLGELKRCWLVGFLLRCCEECARPAPG